MSINTLPRITEAGFRQQVEEILAETDMEMTTDVITEFVVNICLRVQQETEERVRCEIVRPAMN